MIKRLVPLAAGLIMLAVPAIASAHVIVTPGQAKVGDEQLFSVAVPNEQQTAVTNVKLDIPAGVADVVPTVKPGWTITATDSSITWSAGTIPVGQRDDFSFNAQLPAGATELDWKAYQTYADGTVVHWDQKPAGSDDSTGNAGPYSVTKVVNDLTDTSTASKSTTPPAAEAALLASIVAIVVSAVAILGKKRG